MAYDEPQIKNKKKPLSTFLFSLHPGIPFLSERSKHRVEAADNSSVDEDWGGGGGSGMASGWAVGGAAARNHRKHLEKLLNGDIEDILKTLQR